MPKEDPQGRLITVPHAVRGAVFSAAATLTNGTATTLTAGDADYFFDIIEISLSTSSVAAAATLGGQVDLINDGTIIRSFGIPSGNSQFIYDVPLKQATKNTPWVLDMSDISNTSVFVGATLIKKDNTLN